MAGKAGEYQHLTHEFAPVYDANSRILILGSFPSVKSREQQFFYGHPQNRFWKVLAAVLSCGIPQTIQEKKEMLLSHGSQSVTSSAQVTVRSEMWYQTICARFWKRGRSRPSMQTAAQQNGCMTGFRRMHARWRRSAFRLPARQMRRILWNG